MAHKARKTYEKRKGKAITSTSESWEMERFLSRVHQDHFYEVMPKKKVISEVPFKLKRANIRRSNMRSEEEVGKFSPTPFNKSKS